MKSKVVTMIAQSPAFVGLWVDFQAQKRYLF